MIQIYFINLDASVERRLWFEGQASRLGLVAGRFEARDGRNLSECELKKLQELRGSDIWMGPAEIGCFLSHREVWKRIQEADQQWTFVAEDDLHLAEDCIPFFEESDWIPAKADLVRAETTFRKCHRESSPDSILMGRNVRRLISWHGGAGGYFISSSAARLLVNATKNICEPADQLLFNPDFGIFDQLRVFQVDPAFGLQDLFFKTLKPRFEKSIIDCERQNRPKRDTLVRIRRELVRPIHQVRRALENRVYSYQHGTVYSSVPYRDRGVVNHGARMQN